MKIGVPREIKDREFRVAITPGGVAQLVNSGHSVLIESSAGKGSSFSDSEYLIVGGNIVPKAEDCWSCDMVVKVKEPQLSEFKYLRKDLILFTYLHLAAEYELTLAMLKSKVIGIAYETVELKNGSKSN